MKKGKNKLNKKSKPEIFYGLLGYFLGVFAVNIASKESPGFLFNPFNAIEFLGTQISIITDFPRIVALPLGFLLTVVPLIFFYFISKEIMGKKF
jgi:hypothetical protein